MLWALLWDLISSLFIFSLFWIKAGIKKTIILNWNSSGTKIPHSWLLICDIVDLRLLICEIADLWDCWSVRLLICEIVDLWDCWSVRLLICEIADLWDCWSVRLLICEIADLRLLIFIFFVRFWKIIFLFLMFRWFHNWFGKLWIFDLTFG